jgi:hypothetical protein
MLWVALFLGCFVLLLFIGCGYLYRVGHRYANEQPVEGYYQAISVNSFKPSRGIIPERGSLIIDAAMRLAEWHCCPILLLAGQTVKGDPRMEGKIYAEYIAETIKEKELVKTYIKIITGRNPENRTTDSDVYETCMYCVERKFDSIIVIGAWPQIPRIIKFWKRYNKDGKIKTQFVGVQIAAKWYLWELGVWIAEWFFPPGSQRREKFLI